jgi:short-subunit dehydrogenase
VNLAGRSVLLTGATGGLGHAIARRLRAAGAELVLTGRRAEVLEPLATETGARSVAVDLADSAQVERLAREHAGVDVLVANAGLPGSGLLTSFSIEEIDRALAVNLRAPMVLARVLSEPMVARGSGHLVFMSSLAGKVGTPRSPVYSATKFGLRGFAQSLREDLRPSGVGVSAIFPGFVRDAGMFHDTGTKLPPGVGTVSPQDVADAVVRAIERNRGEVDVAPVGLSAGAKAAGLAPDLAATVQRKLGGQRIAEDHVAAQTTNR